MTGTPAVHGGILTHSDSLPEPRSIEHRAQRAPRTETGPFKPEGDWTGVFIRGDSALMSYAPALSAVLKGSDNLLHRATTEHLLSLLRSCAE